jgi:hypothetical protein
VERADWRTPKTKSIGTRYFYNLTSAVLSHMHLFSLESITFYLLHLFSRGNPSTWNSAVLRFPSKSSWLAYSRERVGAVVWRFQEGITFTGSVISTQFSSSELAYEFALQIGISTRVKRSTQDGYRLSSTRRGNGSNRYLKNNTQTWIGKIGLTRKCPVSRELMWLSVTFA